MPSRSRSRRPNTSLSCKSAAVLASSEPIQSHVPFNPDNDGIIWPYDTYAGFRALGFGVLFSLLAVVIIHASFSWFTFGTALPDPSFRLRVELTHRAKHGSDSESFTEVGGLDMWRFKYIFDKYSSAPHTHLTFAEGVCMIHGNRNPLDPFGWFAAVFEWGATYLMLWPEDGRISKEDIYATIDVPLLLSFMLGIANH